MSKPATRSPKRKPQVVLSALRGEISIAVAAVLCLALPLGCSASRDAAPSEDVIVVPPSTSVLDVGDARPAAGVDGAPVRSGAPAAGPAPAPTTTDAETHPTAPTEAASLAPPSTEATPPAVAEPDIDPAGTETVPRPLAVPEPVSTDPAPTGTEPTAAPGPAPDIDPAGTEPTPSAAPNPSRPARRRAAQNPRRRPGLSLSSTPP